MEPDKILNSNLLTERHIFTVADSFLLLSKVQTRSENKFVLRIENFHSHITTKAS